MKPTSLAEVRAVLQRMNGNAADAVALATNLPDLVSRLEPPSARLMSRPSFERATLWTYSAQFEDIEPGQEAPPEVIRVQRDLWVRGVDCQVLWGPPLAQADIGSYVELWSIMKTLFSNAPNARQLVELNWRVDARQGFISTGTSETLERASLIAGDGVFSAPLDWRLQKDQTIEVRCRSLIEDVFPAAGFPTLANAGGLVIRWVVVSFWGEGLDTPSVR